MEKNESNEEQFSTVDNDDSTNQHKKDHIPSKFYNVPIMPPYRYPTPNNKKMVYAQMMPVPPAFR